MDKDFGEHIFTENIPHHGVVRLPDVPTGQRVALMKRVLTDHGSALSKQAIVTVRGGRIRISRTSV